MPVAKVWRHIHFSTWRARPINTTSGFVFCWCHCLQKVKVKFRQHISIHGWDITTSVFEKQTSAILKFYFRAYFPHVTSPIVVTPKRTFLGRNHVVLAIQRKYQCDGSTWTRDREKIENNKKVTKVLYFPYLGGSRHWTDLTQKLRGEWCPRRNHVCQVSNWNFHGLWFYRRSNFRFSYWFLHGLMR